MEEFVVTSQEQLDALPADFDSKIIIQFGTPRKPAVIKQRFKYFVEALDNSTVEARGNSTVTAWGNSTVTAWGNSTVTARGNSTVTARGNSTVTALDNSTVEAWGNSTVTARGNSTVTARGNSTVTALDNSTVTARGNSTVTALDNSTVEAWGNSTVTALDNSTVTALDNSTVTAWGNVQVVDCTNTHNIETHGNSRVVHNPRNIEEYCDHNGIQITDGKVRLYKAVHSRDGYYTSDHDPHFCYVVGTVSTVADTDTDNTHGCGPGIHIAHKAWAVDHGRGWSDLAILEVEADADRIIVPLNGSGKVRTDTVTVIREVPLEECGILGKMLAKKRKAK